MDARTTGQGRTLRRRIGPFEELSEGARARSLRDALSGRDPSALWIFAYGSLMWDPCFSYDARRVARLDGYRRGFTIWTALARGTPERPGLGLALEAGTGCCHGVAYRLTPSRREEGLAAIWKREMVTGIYRPFWLPVTTAEGRISALCFVVDRTHRQYAGDLPPAEAASIIAAAEGRFGTCRQYLADTLSALGELDIREPDLDDLMCRVQRHLGTAHDAARCGELDEKGS